MDLVGQCTGLRGVEDDKLDVAVKNSLWIDRNAAFQTCLSVLKAYLAFPSLALMPSEPHVSDATLPW
ncbi:hypothetical protein DPMN_090356 [Dreissena polymorpha]|uniref:Uncharacterized protein n=1 Tax=Dreissena polymorpha TaxID=45954 RepID=A0A9D4KYH0_DREPO|nr:hypothetical protein DPMN_090356 [Dreissena polymorpha]